MRTLALTSHLSIHTKTLNQEAHVQSLKRPEFCSNIFIQLLKDNFKYTKRTQGQILQSCPMRLPVHEQHGYLVVRVQSHPERLRAAHMCQHDACTEHWRARQSHLYSQDSYPTHSCICIKLRTLKGSPAAPI